MQDVLRYQLKERRVEMILPSVLAILIPVLMGIVFGVAGVMGLLVGALGAGFVLSGFYGKLRWCMG